MTKLSILLLNSAFAYQIKNHILVETSQANSFLSVKHRHKRSNDQFMEEQLKGSDLERECNEEACNMEELMEIAENDFDGRNEAATKWANDFFLKKTRSCYDRQVCNPATTVLLGTFFYEKFLAPCATEARFFWGFPAQITIFIFSFKNFKISKNFDARAAYQEEPTSSNLSYL